MPRTHDVPQGVVDAEARRVMERDEFPRARTTWAARFRDVAVLLGVYVFGFALVLGEFIAARAHRIAKNVSKRVARRRRRMMIH